MVDADLADKPEGVQLLLEPDAHPAAKPFKAALMADGIPFTSFAVEVGWAGEDETENSYVVVAARKFQTQGKRGCRNHL